MDKSVRISHESIYSAIYAMPRGELRSEVIGLLRKSHKTRRPRARGDDRLALIPNMTSIDERLVPGHWKGDLIKGAYNPFAGWCFARAHDAVHCIGANARCNGTWSCQRILNRIQ